VNGTTFALYYFAERQGRKESKGTRGQENMNRRKYKVTISHPTGFHKGTKVLTINETPGRQGLVFITGEGFGCSRDYLKSDKEAIKEFMTEHGCSVVKVTKVR
jgi:hypothetical protein